jgi:hypothetical protein
VPTDVDQAVPAAGDPDVDDWLSGPESGADDHLEGDPGPPWESTWPIGPTPAVRTGLRGALRSSPPGLRGGWRGVLIGLLVVQVVAIAGLGVMLAFRFPVFSPIDEEAHFSYIQEIAQHGALPVLGHTPTSRQGLEIEQGTYPRPPTHTYTLHDLGGLSYEALQPPLYYFAAVPAFDLTSNYVDKVYSVRLFDVLLLLATLVAVGRLARVTLRDRWMVGWAFALVFFALPGVLVRFVTISNLPLAALLAVLFVTELWIGWERHSGRRLILAGLFLGLAVLSQLEQLFLIPVFAVVIGAEALRRWRTKPVRSPDVARTRRTPARRYLASLLVAVAVPVVLVGPWLAFNEAHYDMLTAGPIAVTEQTPVVNPHHYRYSVRQLPSDTVRLLGDPTLPEEWSGKLAPQPALFDIEFVLAALMVPASLVVTAGLGRRLRSMPVAILGLPFLFNVLELWYIRYGVQWQITVRYLYTSVPILLVLAAGASLAVFRSRYLPVLVAALATAGTLSLWGFFLWAFHGTWALT